MSLKAIVETPKANARFVSIKIGNETISKFKKSEIVSIGKYYDPMLGKDTDDTLIGLSNGYTFKVNEDLKTISKKLRIY